MLISFPIPFPKMSKTNPNKIQNVPKKIPPKKTVQHVPKVSNILQYVPIVFQTVSKQNQKNMFFQNCPKIVQQKNQQHRHRV